MLQNTKMFFGGMLLLGALVISSNAHAAPFLIDDFTDSQTVTDFGTPGGTGTPALALSVGASNLAGVQRTLFADATGGDLSLIHI